jgi:AcrR family transcriptional regulator
MARKNQPQQTHGEIEETRQTILTVAHRLFMQYGYRSVTTRQLADACGLTQPALYHHFPDKQALYLAVITEEIARVKVALERITRRSDVAPELLRHVASFLLGRVQYDLSLMLHDVRYEMSPEVRQQLDEQFRNGFILPIAAIFEQGIQQGQLQRVEEGGLAPFSAAFLFMNMLSYFAREQQRNAATHAGPASPAASADALVRILLHGIARSELP